MGGEAAEDRSDPDGEVGGLVWYGMEWCGTGRGGMGWSGVGWDGVEWDGTGWGSPGISPPLNFVYSSSALGQLGNLTVRPYPGCAPSAHHVSLVWTWSALRSPPGAWRGLKQTLQL